MSPSRLSRRHPSFADAARFGVAGRRRRVAWSGACRAIAMAALGLLPALPAAAQAVAPISTVRYACADNRTIRAAYYSDKVELVLGDGREMTLPQTMSGSGIRYANPDESFVFWSKGADAFVTEGTNQITTYAGCTETPA